MSLSDHEIHEVLDMIDKTEAKMFADEVKEWVGNSPYKAAAFGIACGLLGSVWGYVEYWPL